MDALRRHPILATLGGVVALIVGVVAINAFDQELTPEARALFTRQRVAFSEASGWALLEGFHAPPGQEPRSFAAGLRKASLQRKPGERKPRGEKPLEVMAPTELLCVPQDFDCVRMFAQRPESVADLVADNEVLLRRYEELLASRQLADVVEALEYYEADMPHFQTVLRVQQVGLARVGADASAGRMSKAVEWLGADASFHRAWLEEAGSILTKMLAIRTLSRDFLVAGQLARSGLALAPAQWQALEAIAAPLTAAQRGVAPVHRIEAALYADVLDALVKDSRKTGSAIDAQRWEAALVGATMRRNATLNFAHPLFVGWMALDTVPAGRLDGEVARIRASIREAVQPDWTWIYNYTGKSFTAGGMPDLAEYVYRVRDLDALATVIRCTIELRRNGVAREAAAAHAAASPACIDPYEGKPLGWDAGRGELSYKARSAKQVERFGGRDGRVAFAAYLSP